MRTRGTRVTESTARRYGPTPPVRTEDGQRRHQSSRLWQFCLSGPVIRGEGSLLACNLVATNATESYGAKLLHGALGLRGWHDRRGPPEVHHGRWGSVGEYRRESDGCAPDCLTASTMRTGVSYDVPHLPDSAHLAEVNYVYRFSIPVSPRGGKRSGLKCALSGFVPGFRKPAKMGQDGDSRRG